MAEYGATAGGALSGAATGMSVGGPWGALIGAVAGGAMGLSQDQKANKARIEAEKLARSVPNVDPRMMQHLQDIQLKAKYLAAGTGSEFMMGKRNIDQINAQTNANLVRTTGGNSAQLIDSLLRSESIADDKLNELSEGLAAQNIGMLNMQTPIIQDMADRTYALQRYGRDTAQGYASGLERDNYAMLNTGLSVIPEFSKSFGNANPMSMDAYQAPQMMQPIRPEQPAMSFQPAQRSPELSSSMLSDASRTPQYMQPIQPDLSYMY